MPMQIMLSTQVADEAWGKNALLSFHQAQATIHVTDYSARNTVQKAARKLRGQGIKDVVLAGENWDLETCWAFYQGFYRRKTRLCGGISNFRRCTASGIISAHSMW